MRHARLTVAIVLSAAAIAAGSMATGQQPKGEPFSTAIMKLKEGLYVIPGL